MGRVETLIDIKGEAEDLEEMLGDLDTFDGADLAYMVERCKGKVDMIWHLANGALQEPEVMGG